MAGVPARPGRPAGAVRKRRLMAAEARDLPGGSGVDAPGTSGGRLRGAILAASAWLDGHAERVNGLNVFPVPDGDTGTNMSLTLQAAADAVRPLPGSATAAEVARVAYQAAMMGARGNSGVILSQLLRGFAQATNGKESLAPHDLAFALSEASRVAYRGVSRPVEGTILTVARKAAEAAEAAARLGQSNVEVLAAAVLAAADAVAETPNQLAVLRMAGVVDSGGEGYRVVLEGAWRFLSGRDVGAASAAASGADPRRADLAALAHGEGHIFGFCTEFLLEGCALASQEVQAAMEALGESVIAVGDVEMLRVHVHTLRPGLALEFAVDHGTLAKVKIENMTVQHREIAARSAAAAPVAMARPPSSPVGTIGVVAVVPGDGLGQVFRSLGAMVVGGGQTMNPSVQEILAAVNGSGYPQVVLLPNNTNVLLAARHAAALATHACIDVIETRTVPQGIGALLAFNFQTDLATNVAAMTRAAHTVRTLECTRAVRDAVVGDGLRVGAGEFLALLDGDVVATAPTAEAAVLEALGRAPTASLEIATVYYGQEADEEAANALAAAIRVRASPVEVEVVAGGQPHYPFIVSLE